jgi:UDP:flavonoid glycosyltransferase YjiC (YdhE family)
MPWSPTQSFPHPLANIQSSNADVNMTNFVSYALVEMMTWQGLGDVINRFRERALGLDPISLIWAPGMLSRLRVPYTYCWSPALIPKPKDWGQHISISGFYFLSLASSFTPAPELADFLAAGPPPVYIGFGSIVVDDPDAMTKMIFEAVKKAGVRALVSKGWGGLGADALGIPDGVFMLGNVPHDWLFQHVSCVVHHGGAGTTAAGIATGKPTVIVPFFGDQPFWGAMVARAGAGPLPIPYKQLTADNLAAAITEAIKPETLEKAKELGLKIKEEKGTEQGGKHFHDLLDVDNLRCSLAPSKVAVWRVKRTKTRLSALAATVLANEGLLVFADLKLYRPREYETEDGPWDPISGGASALLGTIASLSMGVADFPIEIFKAVKTKHQREQSLRTERESQASSSGSNTPTVTSRSQSDLDIQETAEPKSYEESEVSTLDSSSAPSTKLSYDTARTSEDVPGSPETPLSSVSGKGLQRGRSLQNALRGTLSCSRSRSRDGKLSRSGSQSRRSLSRPRTPKEFDPSKLTLDNAAGAAKGISRIVAAGMKSPMDFTLGLARGFHNAPKLYGDDTVRPQEKVTDFQSGLKAAGREFGFGFYDGISGLITQPIRGAEKEGTAGLLKGIGKGIGGLIMKPGAGQYFCYRLNS